MSRTDGVVVAAASHRLYCVANLREKEEESRGSRGDTLPSVQDAAWCDKTRVDESVAFPDQTSQTVPFIY